MGKLINPGLGELVDRYTILLLKIDKGINVDHFEVEAEEILSRIVKAASSPSVLMAAVRLSTVNALLWAAQDDVERVVKGNDRSIGIHGRLLHLVHRLNKDRARLIHTLNECESGTPLPKEKIEDG